MESEKTLNVCQEDSMEDRVEQARQLSETLRERREEKEKAIKKELETDTTRRTHNERFTGYVHAYESTNTYTYVIVRYVDDGEEKETEIRLEMPQTSSEFSVENEFIKFVRQVGNGDPTDVESTLEREVPLVKRYGNVELDLPNPGFLSHTVHKIRRTVGKADSSGKTARRIKDASLLGVSSAIMAVVIMMSVGMVSHPEYETFYLIADAAFFGLIPYFALFIVFLLPTTLFSFLNGARNLDEAISKALSPSAILTFVCVVGIVFASLFNLLPVIDPSVEGSGVDGILTVMQSGAAGILTIIAAYIAYSPIAKSYSYLKKSINKYRRRRQLRRGVEYADEP